MDRGLRVADRPEFAMATLAAGVGSCGAAGCDDHHPGDAACMGVDDMALLQKAVAKLLHNAVRASQPVGGVSRHRRTPFQFHPLSIFRACPRTGARSTVPPLNEHLAAESDEERADAGCGRGFTFHRSADPLGDTLEPIRAAGREVQPGALLLVAQLSHAKQTPAVTQRNSGCDQLLKNDRRLRHDDVRRPNDDECRAGIRPRGTPRKRR